MDFGIENYKNKQIFTDIDFNPVFVNNGQQRYETLTMEGDLSLLMREDEIVNIEYDIPKVLQAPVRSGSVVGYARYYIDDVLYAEIPISATQDVLKIDFEFCFNKILQLWSQQY
jgi:D-alanyl-D-alanine carboxypeptidase (penicillin-binding protein 5/6)